LPLQDHDVLINVRACSLSAECGPEVIGTLWRFYCCQWVNYTRTLIICVILLTIHKSVTKIIYTTRDVNHSYKIASKNLSFGV